MGTSLSLVQTPLLYRVYRLATMHSGTDRQTVSCQYEHTMG